MPGIGTYYNKVEEFMRQQNEINEKLTLIAGQLVKEKTTSDEKPKVNRKQSNSNNRSQKT